MAMKTWFEHLDELRACLFLISDDLLAKVAYLLQASPLVLTAGNGGSSSLASHAAQALLKPDYKAGNGVPAVCLTDGTPTLTAHANDGGWQTSLLEAAKPYMPLRPTLLLVSSSGKSENLVRLAAEGRSRDLSIVTLTGFTGGPLRGLSTLNVHVDSSDYEVVEPAHDALLHRMQYHLRAQNA